MMDPLDETYDGIWRHVESCYMQISICIMQYRAMWHSNCQKQIEAVGNSCNKVAKLKRFARL